MGTTAADEFYSDNLCHRAMNPFNFDLERDFLHVGELSDWMFYVDRSIHSTCAEEKDTAFMARSLISKNSN